MSTSADLAALRGADPATRIPFGPGPCQDLPLILAAALLNELWKASPDRFGNLLKKAMVRTYPPDPKPSSNGQAPQ